MTRVSTLVTLVGALGFCAQPVAVRAQFECEPCHGELELLRQHVGTLDDARALNVSAEDVRVSAHAETTCTECHTGYTKFPHPDDSSVQQCGTCHADALALWNEGVHSVDGNADCVACHGAHEVRPLEEASERSWLPGMRGTCEACHNEQAIEVDDPHADSVTCSDCHRPHATHNAGDSRAPTHVLNQAATCGECHDSVRSTWIEDAHAKAVPLLAQPGVSRLDGATGADPPVCSGCHGVHSILEVEDDGSNHELSERCSTCHEDFAESFADSYHGQANALGSAEVATCHDCHSGHEIHPADDDRSWVSAVNILDTCQTCHPDATTGFTAFQPHADHHDAEKYPYVYWSYRLMTGLLIGTFTFFGLHSALWLTRTTIDGIRGTGVEGSEHG